MDHPSCYVFSCPGINVRRPVLSLDLVVPPLAAVTHCPLARSCALSSHWTFKHNRSHSRREKYDQLETNNVGFKLLEAVPYR